MLERDTINHPNKELRAYEMALLHFSMSPNQSPSTLLATLNSASAIAPWYMLDRDPSPAGIILHSLSRIGSSAVISSFTSKLADFITWFSAELEQQVIIQSPVWCEIFSSVRGLDPKSTSDEFKSALNDLLKAFDRNLPLSINSRETRRDFTDLIITRQIDDALFPRWLEMVKDARSEKVLYASLIDATRGLLLCPTPITGDILNQLVEHGHRRISNSFKPGSVEHAKILENFSKTLFENAYPQVEIVEGRSQEGS